VAPETWARRFSFQVEKVFSGTLVGSVSPLFRSRTYRGSPPVGAKTLGLKLVADGGVQWRRVAGVGGWGLVAAVDGAWGTGDDQLKRNLNLTPFISFLGRSLEGDLTRTALKRALRKHRPEIHHSDQGVQYAANDYVDRLRGAGVQLSMAAVGEPRENGYAERLMRTIKEEEVDLSEYRDFADARRQLGRFLDAVYNEKRIHSALGYLTPAEFEQQWRSEQTS
jgi:transposase InsO family protein